MLSYGEDPESLSPCLESVPGRDRQTDGQTDRIPIDIRPTRSRQYLPVQLSRVKEIKQRKI